MPRMTGGEAAVRALVAQGVDTLFVLPGVQNDALFSALYDAAERLRVIVTRHEQAAGYMAYGYAAASGRPGAYCVVPGPGFLNTTAALASVVFLAVPFYGIALTGTAGKDGWRQLKRERGTASIGPGGPRRSPGSPASSPVRHIP